MRILMAAILVVAQASAVFQGASAAGAGSGTATMEVTLAVSTTPGASVVAHLLDPSGVERTVAMGEVGEGRYTAVVDLPRVDFTVVFEAVSEGGVLSEPRTLTELGLDRALLGALATTTTTTTPPPDTSRSRWGWLALGAGALALAALLVFAAFSGDEKSPDQDEADPAASDS